MSYHDELAPWEKKNEYYKNLQLGKDIKTQIERIHAQTKTIITNNLSSANEIIASQDRITSELNNIEIGIEDVANGIQQLKSGFEWGISEVVWQIEQNRKVLKDILARIMAPLDTEAKELRKRAEYAYSNGWYDDALNDLLESEKKNRYDFFVHMTIGMIYLFHLVDKDKALEYFEKAIKYAKPKSDFYESYALLYKGLIMRDFGNIEEAEKCTSEAIAISPDFSEAYYQNAQYSAILGERKKSIYHLKEAIKRDKYYCLKAENDPVFDSMMNEVYLLISELTDELKEIVGKKFANIEKTIFDFNEIIKNGIFDSEDLLSIQDFKEEKKKINNLIKENSYFNLLEAQKEVDRLFTKLKKYTSNKISQFKNLSYKIYAQIRDINEKWRLNENEVINKRKKLIDSEYGCVLWVVIFIAWFSLLFIIPSGINSFISGILCLGLIIFMLTGWFFSMALLVILGFIFYRKKDFSKAILKKRNEKKAIDDVLEKLEIMSSQLE